ncbi:MAG: hypothetical protein O7E57_06345 [Gammaproteobacteria bacterium]|nr:hypothetical protein [Gammaproteobacteria bacterium]
MAPIELPGTVTADGRDFGVIRALYESSGEGRQPIGYIGTITTLPGADAMTHGIDTHFLSSGGRLKWDSQPMYSDVASGQGYGAFTDFSYTPHRGLLHRLSFDYIDDQLDISDLGFIRQTDVISGQYGIVRSTSQGLDYFRYVRNSVFVTAQANTRGFLTRAGIFSSSADVPESLADPF